MVKRQITISVTLIVFPFCNHEVFNPTCVWCADASRVAKEKSDIIVGFSEDGQHTKVHVANISQSEGK